MKQVYSILAALGVSNSAIHAAQDMQSKFQVQAQRQLASVQEVAKPAAPVEEEGKAAVPVSGEEQDPKE